jgi:hypothetical protein
MESVGGIREIEENARKVRKEEVGLGKKIRNKSFPVEIIRAFYTTIFITNSKTEELRVNTKSQRSIMLANKAIRRVHDFIYLGSNVSEDGGTRKDVEIRIQNARGAFTRLRKIWLAHNINKDTNIKLFNAYVKSVLLYGCQTWLLTCEIQRKLQSSVYRCLRYIMKI